MISSPPNTPHSPTSSQSKCLDACRKSPETQRCSNLSDLRTRLRRGVCKSDTAFDEDVVGADVVLLVGSRQFYAHRFFLACSSEPFRAMLTGQMREGTEREVRIEGVEEDIFELLLVYIYTGEIDLHYGNVIGCIAASEMFSISGARDVCIRFIMQNAQAVFSAENIVPLPEKILLELIESDDLRIRELNLLEAVVTWGRARCDEKTKSSPSSLINTLQRVMQHIRFPLISVSDLYNKVKPLADIAFPSNLLVEALFYHLKWGPHHDNSECTRPRKRVSKKRKRVQFIQNVTFSLENSEAEPEEPLV